MCLQLLSLAYVHNAMIMCNRHESLQNSLQIIITYPKELILRWILGKLEGVMGTGWSWLRIGTGGGLLWVR
jgi:hypothetical protein